MRLRVVRGSHESTAVKDRRCKPAVRVVDESAGELNEVVNGGYLPESSACADGVAQQGFPWATLLVKAGESQHVVQVGKTNV